LVAPGVVLVVLLGDILLWSRLPLLDEDAEIALPSAPASRLRVAALKLPLSTWRIDGAGEKGSSRTERCVSVFGGRRRLHLNSNKVIIARNKNTAELLEIFVDIFGWTTI